MTHHRPTSWMGVNIHHLHDEESTALAQMIAVALPGSTAIREPVDNIDWSGVRLFHEGTDEWIASLKWVRGVPRDLKQACHQLCVAVSVKLNMELGKPRVPREKRSKGDTNRNRYQSGQQGIRELHDELGIEWTDKRKRAAK